MILPINRTTLKTIDGQIRVYPPCPDSIKYNGLEFILNQFGKDAYNCGDDVIYPRDISVVLDTRAVNRAMF